VSRGRSVAAPCPAVDVASHDERDVIVLCADQSIARSSDGGISWGQPLAAPGATAVTATAEHFAIATGHQDACTSLTLIGLSFDPADPTGTILGCVPLAYLPGETAIDARGEAIWVWAGDRVAVSADGGASWR
jgi:hypothetical protein